MVERRCRATLLAQTEGVAGPQPARIEVNPRAELAQASWSFFSKDQVPSVEKLSRPNTYQTRVQDYSSFGLTGACMFQEAVLFQFTSGQKEPLMYMYDRARIYDALRGQFLSEEPSSDVMKGRIGIKSLYVYVRNHPFQFYDPYGYQATSRGDVCSCRSGQNGELCPPDCTTQFTRVGAPWCDCPPSSQRKQCPLKWKKQFDACLKDCFSFFNVYIAETLSFTSIFYSAPHIACVSVSAKVAGTVTAGWAGWA